MKNSKDTIEDRTRDLPALAHCPNRLRHRVTHVTHYTRFQNVVFIKHNDARHKENLTHNNLYCFID